MREATHVIDPDGEVIIRFQNADYSFAAWSEGKTETESLEPRAPEQSIDGSSDAAQGEARDVLKGEESSRKEKKKNKKKNRKCQMLNQFDSTESTVEPPAEPSEPTAFDEQIDEAYHTGSIDDPIEQYYEEHGKAATPKSESDERIQVSAEHLILSSPVFKKTLTGGWRESVLLARERSVEITTSGWDLEAFLILMDIFHCRPQNLPQEISLELLAKVALLADYYECKAVVRFFALK